MTITLTREEAQQVLDALRAVEDLTTHDDEVYEAIDIIEPLLAQPEREWQGLTDMEIVGIAALNKGNAFGFARTIEAKLKEKNA
jgi:hypothetical protein